MKSEKNEIEQNEFASKDKGSGFIESNRHLYKIKNANLKNMFNLYNF